MLLRVRRGNTVFPVVFPVGGASLPLRSDYPSYSSGHGIKYGTGKKHVPQNTLSNKSTPELSHYVYIKIKGSCLNKVKLLN